MLANHKNYDNKIITCKFLMNLTSLTHWIALCNPFREMPWVNRRRKC